MMLLFVRLFTPLKSRRFHSSGLCHSCATDHNPRDSPSLSRSLSRSISNYVIDIKQLSTDSRHAVSVCANLVRATIANPPERRAKERATREREGERGKGSVKGCALRNRANIYVTESCRRTKKVFLVSKEKKSDAEREIDRERERKKKNARFRKSEGARGSARSVDAL